MKKLLVCCKMFAFFKAIFKFCTAKRLLNRLNKMAVCSLFISHSVFKNKTVENGKNSKNLVKMIKTTLLNNGHQQKSICT